jgi:hypothetical protein
MDDELDRRRRSQLNATAVQVEQLWRDCQPRAGPCLRAAAAVEAIKDA